ncbi:hypothetical protein EBR78_07525, partial [bacterium]|nr:hypothetical protein [bacterium]
RIGFFKLTVTILQKVSIVRKVINVRCNSHSLIPFIRLKNLAPLNTGSCNRFANDPTSLATDKKQ